MRVQPELRVAAPPGGYQHGNHPRAKRLQAVEACLADLNFTMRSHCHPACSVLLRLTPELSCEADALQARRRPPARQPLHA
jgi:hypothetical protein